MTVILGMLAKNWPSRSGLGDDFAIAARKSTFSAHLKSHLDIHWQTDSKSKWDFRAAATAHRAVPSGRHSTSSHSTHWSGCAVA